MSDFIQNLDEKIKTFEGYIKDFDENTDKRLLCQLFVAELKVLRTIYFKDIVK